MPRPYRVPTRPRRDDEQRRAVAHELETVARDFAGINPR